MKRVSLVLRAVLGGSLVVTLCASCAGMAVETEYPIAYDDYPPDGYIATTEPVYIEGRPVYYYRGRYFFRDGEHWRHFEREPTGSRNRRYSEPARRYYEPRESVPRRTLGGHVRSGARRR